MRLVTLMKAIWDFMNGKKTSAGAIILLISAILKYFDFNFDPEQLKAIVEALVSSGAVSIVIGLVHKLIKYFLEKREAEGAQE